MATIIIKKANSSKTKKFFPATEDKPAMLYVDFADTIVKSDKSKKTVWYHCIATRGHAETLYRLMHGDKEVSRCADITGRIVDEPDAYIGKMDKKAHATNTIWLDDVDFRDDKWPEGEPARTEGAEPEAPATEPAQLPEDALPF